ncbi:MAG TPA: biotin/lipoyl-binding protein [Acidobacteria bacterium]|nr:biotin/lipoyl-binding protein [Acidobacteriota bacterium]
MKWIVRHRGEEHEVEVERSADGLTVTLEGATHRIDIRRLDGDLASLRFIGDNSSYAVAYQRSSRTVWRLALLEQNVELEVLTPAEATELGEGGAAAGSARVVAPIPGKVVAVAVAPGDEVQAGQALVVLEAMKMENELVAESAGTVARVLVEPGATVEAGTVLVELE